MKIAELISAFEKLGRNFGFKCDILFIKDLHEFVADISAEQLTQAVNGMLRMTRAEWDLMFSYGKLPTVADWVIFLNGHKPLSIEEVAGAEVEKILTAALTYYVPHKFDNPVTQRVVGSFANGLKTIYFDLHDTFNEKKQDKGFYKKDMVKKWLDFYNQPKLSDKMPALPEKVRLVLPNLKK